MANMAHDGGISVHLVSGEVHGLPESGVGQPLPNDRPEQIRTLSDLALVSIKLEDFPVVQQWRQRLFEEKPTICDELPRLLTMAMQSAPATATPWEQRVNALCAVFNNKTPLVRSTDLLPGQTTTSFVGPVVYADTIGYCIWPELTTVATRSQNPFSIRPEVADRLNKEIFPYWLERRTIQERARYSAYDTAEIQVNEVGQDRVLSGGIDPPLRKAAGVTPRCQELMERVAFYLSDKASAVSHTVPDFNRVLHYGLDGLIAQIDRDLAGASAEQKAFLNGVRQLFSSANNYAQRLAEAAEMAGNMALAAICRKVPARPAATLQEALTTIWICYHLLLQENTNFGLSIGRLDQLLQPYYLADWDKQPNKSAQEAYQRRAVELVCHFFLRCSDHIPLSTEGSETLFAGSGSNQALTVGGVRMENGVMKDAVNDMTYIILKATELLAIRDPNVHARYHHEVHGRDAQGQSLPAGQLDAYMRRICQVNLNTRATPAVHGDFPVIQAMARYYELHNGVSQEEALADACDYASIGCIEQNAAGKHYGHTGSTLMVLPAVLELALFGGKHRSDGITPLDPALMTGRVEYTSKPLARVRTMAEFIDNFRQQLDCMAKHAVQNNNYLGRFWEKHRGSPFLSGLFHGPTNQPGEQGAVFRDVTAGGAKYNSAGVAIIGLADVVDSFCVLETLVFGGKMTVIELLDAMEQDFQPQGKISPERMAEINEMIRLTPKYGAGVATSGPDDNSIALKHTEQLVSMIHDVFIKFRTHRGGRYLPGYWSMTNHAGFGMLTKATPNGRRSGQPFAGGITPCPGIVKPSGQSVMIFDHLLSVAKVPFHLVQNGYTYNLSLTPGGPSRFSQDTIHFGQYLKGFLVANGMLAQMCVASVTLLQQAHEAALAAEQKGAGAAQKQALLPFKDLMIRVAGYSAYFVTLSAGMRQEIIHRANFGMDDGTPFLSSPAA